MKVLRRSFHKDKDRTSSSPPRNDLNFNQPQSLNFNPNKHPPTQPFPSLASNLNNSLNPKSIVKPPTLVIKAITSYKPNRIIEISFQKGDFFHVVGERDDHQGSWFEASNPATGARGIVPKHCFELFGPKQHEPTPSKSTNSHPFTLPPSQTTRNSNQISNPSSSPSLLRTPTSAEAPRSSKPQPLYGIVQHDFAAERPDELDAKKGEPIIVIAQSNHEWFVAKPIGRLGGPGLIPVSFVEVQDVTTGKALAPNQVQELINSSAVPKVEEWKKATAAYKGNSIPLGKFDFVAPSPPVPSDTNHHHRSSHSASISNTTQRTLHGSWHGANGDLSSFREPRQASLSQTPWDENSHHQAAHGHVYDEANAEYGPDGDGYATVDELRERYGVVVHASVESFHFEQGHYWFHLRAHFSRLHNCTNEDNNSQTTTVLVLYRLYEDFYDFQAALLENFPEGPDPKTRLPRMPGPTSNVDELVCSQRVEDLSNYLHDLCELPLEIRESELVYEFLGPREGDVELEGDPGNLILDNRPTRDVEEEVVEYLQRMDSGHGEDQMDGLNQSIARLSTGSNGISESHRHQRQSSHGSSTNHPTRFSKNSSGSHYDHPQRSQDPRTFSSSTVSSDAMVGLSSNHTSVSSSLQIGTRAAPFTTKTSSQNQQHQTSRSSVSTNGNNVQESNGTGFLRIKIYQRQTDDLIAIRAPNGVTYQELIERIRERIGPEVRIIRFRDESGLAYSTGGSNPIPDNNGARLVGIDNDYDLERWLTSGSRLVLYID